MTRREWMGSAIGAALAASPARAQGATRNVILVTADGLRPREVFSGMDPLLRDDENAGMKDADDVRSKFWAETPEERRRRLLPFFWSEIASRGVLLGNRERGSAVGVRNRHLFSYPGYSEILVGRPQDAVIDSNAMRPNPSRTVLEAAREALGLPPEQAALFGSWEVFQGIGASQPGAVTINAGYQAYEDSAGSRRARELSQTQFNLLTPWRTVRHDYVTIELALEHMRSRKPRVLYVALGETDDWAHDRRYDRVVETARYFDECVERLWAEAQGDSYYRNSTTLIASTDHGRGLEPADWHSHGGSVTGADEIWIAAIGPDTPPLGEASNTAPASQSDIAPTILALLGIPLDTMPEMVGRPLAAVTGS